MIQHHCHELPLLSSLEERGRERTKERLSKEESAREERKILTWFWTWEISTEVKLWTSLKSNNLRKKKEKKKKREEAEEEKAMCKQVIEREWGTERLLLRCWTLRHLSWFQRCIWHHQWRSAPPGVWWWVTGTWRKRAQVSQKCPRCQSRQEKGVCLSAPQTAASWRRRTWSSEWYRWRSAAWREGAQIRVRLKNNSGTQWFLYNDVFYTIDLYRNKSVCTGILLVFFIINSIFGLKKKNKNKKKTQNN